MEALASSVSKVLAVKNRNGEFSSSRILFPVCRFPISDKKNVDILHSLSLRLSESVSSSPFSSITLAGVADVDSLPESIYQSNTVHIKFQLQRECLFGEQFFLVGDDPTIGLWDPASAIPLNWSDEHLWMVELDFPIGKSIRFKFILKGRTEEVWWQPGPDRIFETYETKNTIVISEDWENYETQNITEEPSKDPVSDQFVAEDILNSTPDAIDSNSLALAAVKEPAVNENMEVVAKVNTTYHKTTIVREYEPDKECNPSDNPFEGSLVAGNILRKNGIVATDKKLGNAEDENLVGYVQEPALVPGLTPLLNRHSEEVLSTKAESDSNWKVSSAIDGAEDSGMPKPDEEEEEEEQEKKEVEGIQNQEEATFTVIENQREEELVENHELNTEGQVALQHALQNDFQWGRKALSKFLTTLGLS